MPRSKKRKHHQDHNVRPNPEKTESRRSAVMVATLFFGLLGMGIAFFAAGFSIPWLTAGAAAGAAAGYLFGKQIDHSASKK